MKRNFSSGSPKKNIKLVEDALEKSPIIDVKGYPYVIFPLNFHIDPEVLKAAAGEIVKICDLKDVDKIVTMEAGGIGISTAVSMITGIPVVIARRRKLDIEGEIEIRKKTAYGESILYLSGIGKGDRIAIVDDVISTGGSMVALVKTLRKIGAVIKDIAVVYDRRDYGGERRLKEQTGFDVKSIIRIKEVKPSHVKWEPYIQAYV